MWSSESIINCLSWDERVHLLPFKASDQWSLFSPHDQVRALWTVCPGMRWYSFYFLSQVTSGHCLAHMIKWEHHKPFIMGWEGALFKSSDPGHCLHFMKFCWPLDSLTAWVTDLCVDVRYPGDRFPVIALKGAPASFPVREEFVPLHQYLQWSEGLETQALNYITTNFPGETFVGIHLRNGPDWVGGGGLLPSCLWYGSVIVVIGLVYCWLVIFAVRPALCRVVTVVVRFIWCQIVIVDCQILIAAVRPV